MNIVSTKDVHQCAIDKEWWDWERSLPELLCLLHSEVSEAFEGYRNHIQEGEKGCLSEELADIVIRIWDMSEAFDIDIAEAVNKKHQFNLTRPSRHGGKRA